MGGLPGRVRQHPHCYSWPAYRSAELTRDGFEQIIERFHIRTVINLRGASPGKPWYDNELAAALAGGTQHVDLRMSATHGPDHAKLHEIETVLAHAETPILVHCQAGADRSGLVAALYEYWIAHRPPAEAGAQLSFRYGHFPWLDNRTSAMDEAWRSVVRQGGSVTPRAVLAWVRSCDQLSWDRRWTAGRS